jgi:hypothetical protein
MVVVPVVVCSEFRGVAIASSFDYEAIALLLETYLTFLTFSD